MNNKIGLMIFLERTAMFTKTEYVPNKLNKIYSNWWKVMVVLSFTVVVVKMITEYVVLKPF